MITPWFFRLLVCSCLLWTLAFAGDIPRKYTYWVAFSKTVRPGKSLLISTFLHNATGPVTLRMELMDYDGRILQDGRSFLMNVSEDPQTFQFPISSTLPKPSRPMFLHVVGWGGLEFSDFEQMIYATNKRVKIFITLDKYYYTRGQTVRFRALAMLPDKTLSDEPLKIVIRDPYSNRMGQWTRRVGANDSRVVEGELVTSVDARGGTWKIKASVNGVDSETSFRLSDAVNVHTPITHRPTKVAVGVILTVPDKVLVHDPMVPVNISARTLSGSPMQGLASITLTLSHYYRNNVFLTKNVTLDTDGKSSVHFTNAEFLDVGQRTYLGSYSSWYHTRTFSLSSSRFKIRANVKDNSTGRVSSSRTIYLTFHTHAVKLRFPGFAGLKYKPGLPYSFGVLAYDPWSWGNLKNPKGMSVTFNVTFGQDKRVLLTKTVPLDSDAKARVYIPAVPDTTPGILEITATMGTFTYKRSVRPLSSPSNIFLHIQQKTGTAKPKIGKDMEIEVLSNKPLGSFMYQVYGNRLPLMTKRVVVSGKSTKSSFSFRLTQAMYPSCRVVVFVETYVGELLYEQLNFKLDFALSEVSMKFLDKKVKPGEAAKLKVFAAPGTIVFLVGYDKRTSKGRTIRQYEIKNALRDHGYWSSYRTLYGTSKLERFLMELGVGVVTDVSRHVKYSRDGPRPYTNRNRLPKFRNSRRRQPVPPPPPGPPGRQHQRSRLLNPRTTFIPNTWFWRSVHISDKGSEVLKVTTPDIVSTLGVVAIASHPTLGLNAVDEPVEVETIQRLFVTMPVPKYAVVGETVCFTATTYNLHTEDITAKIELLKDASAFKAVLVKPNPQNPGKVREVKESINVEKELGVLTPNSKISTTFCVKPIMLGDMPVRVRVRGNKASDDIVKTIRIKPEGVQHTKAYPVLIEVTSTGEFSQTVDVALPKDIVKGSVRMYVSVTGDVLGNVLNNLQDLLQMPTGSAEQNMIHFAPIVYLIDYLKKTKRLCPAILRKARGLMMAGLQSELRYQRYDGAFSSFGNLEKTEIPGSMWLTAYVIKCLAQAASLGKNGIFIERDVIRRGVGWMTQFQNTNGSFIEPGQVFHPFMQGGSVEVRLTAYVTIALLYANGSLPGKTEKDITARLRLSSALSVSVSYLEGQVSGVGKNDSYTACILAYVLTLAHSSKADEAVSKMNGMAVTEGNLKYWPGATKSVSIEMTSYALLTLKHTESSSDIMPLFRWLNNQRGPRGEFISARDTVVGVEALSSMTDVANESPIKVEATWKSGAKSLAEYIDKDSVLKEHKFDIAVKKDKYPEQVTITAKSSVKGKKSVFVLAEVVTTYSVDNKKNKEYDVKPMIVRKNLAKAFILKPCLSRYGDNTTSQTDSRIVMEIGVPSGYEVNRRTSRYGNSSGVNFAEDKVVLYYNKSVLSPEGDCPVMKMSMTEGTVAHSKPSPIVVYDYDSPAEKKYIITYKINNYNVCELMTDIENCSTNS